MLILVTKIKDLTVEEFKTLLTLTIKDVFIELVEDFAALSSDEFLRSIKEARNDFLVGNVKSFEEVFDV